MASSGSKLMGVLSTFNTLLNDYPALMNVSFGETNGSAFTLLLDISKLFGMGQERLVKWMASLLVDDDSNPKFKGVLTVLEDTVKAALLMYFKSLYTCPIEPVIPDSFLKYAHESSTHNGEGVSIPISTIDFYNLLWNCPTTETGSIYYFDVTAQSVGQPYYLYRSTDMNAWLWWIINKAPKNNWQHYTWDNRVYFRKKFEDKRLSSDGTVGDSNRIKFVDQVQSNSQAYVILNGNKVLGYKQDIICANYVERGTTVANSNTLYVYGVAERYRRTGLLGQNKTVSDFNTDYITSLKLFDSKTLAAQIINAVCGLSSQLFGTIEFSILSKKIEKLVEKVIDMPAETVSDDYFGFSEEEYNDIVNDATLSYNGQYATQNETNDIITPNSEEISQAILKIDSAITSSEKEVAIVEAFTKVEKSVSLNYISNWELIKKFLKETMIQLALQVLTPKVMILFRINEYFMQTTLDDEALKLSFDKFWKDFFNILTSCILKFADLIISELMDLVLGFIRPMIALICEKLLLETLTYYKDLLAELISCIPSWNFKRGNLTIDNVNYADIIPEQTTPTN